MPATRKTESASDIEDRRGWFSKWWSCLLLVAIIVWGIIDYLWIPKSDNTELIRFLISGIGVLAVVIYVIYTRDLATSSQQIALANIRLVESTQSRILEQWFVEKCETVNLINGGAELSRVLHVSDKHIAERRYDEYTRGAHPRVLIFRPMNMGARPVILKNVKFKISDSRSKLERDISYDPGPPVVLQKDSSIDIQVCYDKEGEINARVAEIDYQDGNVRQTLWLANPFTEGRYEPGEEPEEEPEDEIPF